MNRHLRKATLVSTVLTAGLLMTACQNGHSAGAGSSSHTSKASAAAKQNGTGTGTGVSALKGSSGSSGSSGSKARPANGSRGGATRQITGGTVSYLAPGKYLVRVSGKTDRAFFTADDTAVYGAGRICGSLRSEERPRCTLDQLETAAKKAAVTADVTMRKGIATVVRERHDVENGTGSGTGGSGTKGVSGTWFGNVSYLAPGKYTVSDMKGVQQAFYVADSTVVRGAGKICGSSTSGQTHRCTLGQLETAAKKGVSAKVVVANGVATTITEDH
ncbi:hypothetical protein ABZ915_09845 [Streptomyces sp. NPDC046915]|uniref:hypothetical protein n=1 Tax=Streptomyces sp. NPDC046915 TaxID=3155257 RepID=UPI0033CB116D